MNSPTFIPIKRHFRKRKQQATTAPPPALTLVAANYEPDGPNVNMHFDRDVDISGIDPAAIEVLDGPGGQLLRGTTANMPDTNWVQVQLENAGVYAGDDALLNASSANGIVAMDGGVWGGADAVGLPFP